MTLATFLIVCPLVFFAGLIDAIGGGGGLISLPAYLLAGLPPHNAIATNKLSSSMGTTVATVRLCRGGNVHWKLAVLTVVLAMLGSSIGANLNLLVSDDVMVYVLVAILPVTAFVVLNKKLFKDREEAEVSDVNSRTYIVASVSALIIGMYDGFYGPGTGTFLILAFTVFARMNIRSANAHAKIINLTTNITSMVVFLMNGEGMILLGLVSGVCNMVGGWLGAGLMIKNGTKIVRPSIIFVLILLLVKVLLFR
ncbi:MAG: TSUP family transporter [Treponema sp.]|nr:TSUP family transporter [Treponema sp.]